VPGLSEILGYKSGRRKNRLDKKKQMKKHLSPPADGLCVGFLCNQTSSENKALS
jgi:hypothetical protein